MTDDDPLELRMGVYRHYKGPLYLVVGLAHDANADTLGTEAREFLGEWVHDPVVVPLGERTVVVYVPLQLDGAHLGPRMAVRTLEDFLAWVPCSVEEHSWRLDNQRGPECGRFYTRWEGDTPVVPRFEYLGPVLTQEALQ